MNQKLGFMHKIFLKTFDKKYFGIIESLLTCPNYEMISSVTGSSRICENGQKKKWELILGHGVKIFGHI